MLSFVSFRLEDFLDNAFDDVDDCLALLPNRVQLPLEHSDRLPDLCRDHLVELLVFFSLITPRALTPGGLRRRLGS